MTLQHAGGLTLSRFLRNIDGENHCRPFVHLAIAFWLYVMNSPEVLLRAALDARSALLRML
jgi:hypothetical protein